MPDQPVVAIVNVQIEVLDSSTVDLDDRGSWTLAPGDIVTTRVQHARRITSDAGLFPVTAANTLSDLVNQAEAQLAAQFPTP